MNKVIKFQSSNQRQCAIEETACAWLAKLEAGATEGELKALSAWLFESKEHVEIFFEVIAAWDQLSILSELSEVFPLDNYKLPTSGRKTGFWTGLVMVASLAIVLVVGVLGIVPGNWQRAGDIVDVTIYKTDVGQRSTVTLPDLSEIVLNTNTLIEVRYSGAERRIVLDQGEALFTVTQDLARPFRVVAGNHLVEAIGTAFTVQKSTDNTVEVMVKEGVVDFRSLGDSRNSNLRTNGRNNRDRNTENSLPDEVALDDVLSLVAGEVVITEGLDRDDIQKQNLPLEEIESRLSWQYGMLFFLDDPLDQVLREINRYTTTVIVADDEVRDIRVDGSFRVGDIDALLLAMQENFGVEVTTLVNGNIFLTK